MRDEHRFASLNGAGRKWLTADDFELDAETAFDDQTAADTRLGAEVELDARQPIMPRRHSLARLGDLFAR